MSQTTRTAHITPIGAAEIAHASLTGLANRPGDAAPFGEGGLSPAALKERLTALARLAVDKINEVVESFGDAATPGALTQAIYTAVPDPEEEDEHLSLGACLEWLLHRLGACERQGASANVEMLDADAAPVVSVSVATDPETGARVQRFFFSLPRGERGARGITPLIRINEETLEWEVSSDAGVSFEPLGVGAVGPAGARGEPGTPGARGERGEQGERGRDFHITKVYESEEEMRADHANGFIAVGDMVAIRADVEEESNARVYVKSERGFEFFLDLSGAQGIQGPRGERGERGESGVTPVCGVDYFTEADVDEMVDRVLAALPSAEGVSF